MSRPTYHEVYLTMAFLVAERATCLRRSVGCVLVDATRRVLSTGYNGVARGQPHCNDRATDGTFPHACPGATAPPGQRLDDCGAIHAEQNALLQTGGRLDDLDVCYVTVFPCVSCTKLLLATPCQLIVYADDYPLREAAEKLWTSSQHPATGARRETLRVPRTRLVNLEI